MHDHPLSRRDFVRAAASAGLLAALPAATGGCSGPVNPARETLAKILVVGGGAAGLAMAATLRRQMPRATITLAEPSERHVCQPALSLVAAGYHRTELITRDEAALIPSDVRWVRSAVAAIDAENRTAELVRGERIRYDFLVLTPGVQQNWSAVEGVSLAALGRGNVHSVYDREGADRTWRALKRVATTGGRALFADTWTPSSCSGATKSACLLTEDLARKYGTRGRLQLDFFTAARQLCDVPHCAPRLQRIFSERKVPAWTGVRLVAVDMSAKRATFEQVRTNETFTEEFEFLHFAPPQSAPDFVRDSGLGCAEGDFAEGAWVDVDPRTLLHRRHRNIVSLGDAAALPAPKTTSAIRRQVAVAAMNLGAVIAGQRPAAVYDGYAANPVATDFGHVLRMEADYSRRPAPAFPHSLLDPTREQSCAWLEFRHLTLRLYFDLLLRGLA